MFYVGLLKPYHDHLVVDHEVLVPQMETLSQTDAFASPQTATSNEAVGTRPFEGARASHTDLLALETQSTQLMIAQKHCA